MPEAFALYLDQMFPVTVAQALRAEGHDVLRASEIGQARADDARILEQARADRRVLVTLDKHFGDWVILPLCEHPGVIRVKVKPTTAENVIHVLVPFLRAHAPAHLTNCLVLLSAKRSKWIRTQ